MCLELGQESFPVLEAIGVSYELISLIRVEDTAIDREHEDHLDPPDKYRESGRA